MIKIIKRLEPAIVGLWVMSLSWLAFGMYIIAITR